MKFKKAAVFTLKWLFIIAIVAFTVYPVLYITLASFKSKAEFATGSTHMIPHTWTVQNYVEAWQKADFARYTLNSLIFCGAVTIGSLLISSMAGYCMARKNFFGKKVLNAIYMSMMFISLGAVVYRPLFMMFVKLKLNNTLLPIILIQIGCQASHIFLVTRFVKGVPKELDEAAAIDGCSTFRIYWNIILPLIRPIMGVIGLFAFRDAWNSYILPAIFTGFPGQEKLRTLTVGVVMLKNMGEEVDVPWHLVVAGASIAVIPMLGVYFAANKQFISGLSVGSVKG